MYFDLGLCETNNESQKFRILYRNMILQFIFLDKREETFTSFIPMLFWPKRKKTWGKIQTGVLFAMDMEEICA